MVHAQYLSMGREHDYRSALEAITAPVLVVHGADDLQTEAVSHGYVASVAHGQLAILTTGRFPFFDQPEAFASLLVRFLDSQR